MQASLFFKISLCIGLLSYFMGLSLQLVVFGGRSRNSADLLSTAFLQPVNHLLKLQEADLHLLFQLVDKRLVIRVQVVVGLLCVQAESWREVEERKTIIDEDRRVWELMKL